MKSEFTRIRTSEAGWLTKLAKLYKNEGAGVFVDDAKFGVDPATDSVFRMARKAHLTVAEIAAACIACGMGAAGVAIVVLAVLDPEPTSKLAVMTGGGVLLALTGGMAAIYVLSNKRPPNIKFKQGGFEISWA